MKKKIVIEVRNCEKCRRKARKVAAGFKGVDSVSMEGNDKEKVVIVGEGVDAVRLVELMRKKVGQTELLTAEDVKPKGQEEKKPERKDAKPSITCECRPVQYYWPVPYPPQYIACETVYDHNPSACGIM